MPWPRLIRSESLRRCDKDAILGSDADCVVYTGPATNRPREAIEDFCRILEAGKNIVTTSLPGLVYPRGSMREPALTRLSDSANRGNSSIYSTGIEPGFGCDLFAVALTSMSSRIYSIRGLEITDYSRDNLVYEMRELFGFGQPLDYQGGVMTPGVITFGWARPSRWSAKHSAYSWTRSVSPVSSLPPRVDSRRPPA